MNRARKPNETYEEYRKSQNEEAALIKERLQGHYVHYSHNGNTRKGKFKDD